MNNEAIAVIGMAGRFPGAPDIAHFWNNLRQGVESIRALDREALAAQGVAPRLLDDPLYVRAGAPLEDVELFDADFFGLSPREAEITDPQHRVFLECAWQALEDSGYDAERHDGRIGVYAGAGLSTYLLNQILRRPDVVESAGTLPLQLGNNKDYVPLRVSYKLRLRGPSVNVNTACSTSLVAVHLACQALLDGHCDLALAGGVGIQLPQHGGYLYSPNGILSPDGHCRAFDADAQGTVSGNGAGLVVLKRYADAVADGDSIRAVILGSAINNDGGDKVGFTAPSVEGQAEVIGEALAVAGVDAADIGYVEAHGTATPLGDPIEVQALKRAFGADAPAQGCALGSVKTNIGHLDEAAGIAGLIKTVLAVQHGQIPPSLHFQRPNPALGLESSPFYVPTQLTPWPGPRHAGVSSFGLGGTNAHVVLREAPPAAAAAPAARPWQLLTLSARTPTALQAQRQRLAAQLRAQPEASLADVAYTLAVGRKELSQRAALACRDVAEAIRLLEAPAAAAAPAPAAPRPVVFLFPGQGSPYPGMGQGLYRSEPVYRQWIDRCAQRLLPALGFDLREVLAPRPEQADVAATRLARTDVAQPALFALELALARLLEHWGVKPQAMIGHSLGEYVAACLAGVWSWEEALDLVAERGRLMQAMPAGAMLAVELSEAELQPLLGTALALAAVNAPGLCVAAGEAGALAALQQHLEARGVVCRPVATSHAFHSAAMEPVLEPLRARLQRMALRAPAIPFVSTLTGDWITPAQATDPDYWLRHLRHTVRFSDGLERLLRQGGQAFLEVGPGRTLASLLRRHEGGAQVPALAALRHREDPREDLACVLDALGQLWVAGAWRKSGALHAGEARRRVPLPTYPFERQRYWVDAPAEAVAAPAPVPAAAPAEDAAPPLADAPAARPIEDWFHVPSWTRRAAASMAATLPVKGSGWVVLADAHGLGALLAQRLRDQGARVAEVNASESFEHYGGGRYALNPCQPQHLERLFTELARGPWRPSHVLHLCAWAPEAEAGTPLQRWDVAQAQGFDSLLLLAQVLARHELCADLSLDVITSGMQSVLDGEQPACPEKATVLGPVRVLPLEYPGLRCRAIDLTLGLPHHDDVELLLAELLRVPEEPVLALREGALWEQRFTARPLSAPAGRPAPLREGSTYLVTGGLGSMGLALARSLAQEARAKLVLVGRHGLPAEDQWDAWSAGQPVLQAEPQAEEAARIDALVTQAYAQAGLLDIDADAQLRPLLDDFCAALVARWLAEAGVALQDGQRLEREALRRQLKLLPIFHGFLDFLLGVLAARGIVRAEGEALRVADAACVGQVDDLRARIVALQPRLAGLLELAEGCAARYGEALSGAVPSISVLYPDGTPAWMDGCRREVPEYAGDNACVLAAAQVVAALAAEPGERPLRILEVGGGGGTLTQAVVQALRERAGEAPRAVEYHFTDLGPTLVRRAEQKAAAAGVGFMRFGTLDISRDPTAQGWAEDGFDLVLGYNVVHATARLDQTLAHLRRLLAPGGQLLLAETTWLRPWDEMVWGLTEGWWHFMGDPCRGGTPLIALEAWEALLREQGFEAVAGYPRTAAARRGADCGLVMARRPHTGAAERVRAGIEAVREMRRAGAEVLVAAADLSDAAALRALLQQVQARFGGVDGVVHTAGVLGQGLAHDKTPAQTAAVFAGKARGLLTLETLLQEQGLSPALWLLCGSLASVAPIAGQIDYCAANAFLDAWAAQRDGRDGVRALAIDWGFWQELGMIEQARMAPGQREALREGLRRLAGRPDAGVEVFRRLLDAAPALPARVLVTLESLEAMRAASGARPVSHPWFEPQPLELGETQVWVTRLDSRDWVLDEHRPIGRAVLPGTAYLELACAALTLRLGRRQPLQLDDVYFLLPLIVEDGARVELRTLLTPRGAGFEFVVASRAGDGLDEWLEHARGEIAPLETPQPPPRALQAIAQRCTAADLRVDDAAGPGHGADTPLGRRVRGFTPHWRCFERVRLGQGEGLASLRLAPAFVAETAGLLLHPALSDMATGFLTMADALEQAVPFGYRRVRVWQPLGPALHSHVRAAEAAGPGQRGYDATLLDEQGRVLVEVAGFAMKEPIAGVAAVDAAALPVAERNYRMEIVRRGSLDTLAPQPCHRRAPGPGEVEVEVAATGLNFIEVLYALGLLPEAAGGEASFGLECAGHVSALGEGVEGLRVGDAVYGFVPASLSRYAVTRAYTLAPVPPQLTLEQAAALPAAYSTAWFALLSRGRLRRGEQVLIHAAAGGVGLAAVHIALWRGAQVFATAGSEDKREYLRGLGVAQAWDSRSLAFAQQARDATGGRGVDLVLNSLGGDFIAAGLGTLARHGRFVELGKRDILRDTPLGMGVFDKHLSFMAVDVGPDLPGYATLWRQVSRAIRQGALPPLPVRGFALDEVAAAFEHMAQARHIGKVVVRAGGEQAAAARPAATRRGRPFEELLGRGAQAFAVSKAGEKAAPAAAAAAPAPAVAAPGHGRPALATPFRAPASVTEEVVVSIWQELLGLAGIGVDDNFFELRGDSLLAAQVTSRLYAAFQVKLPLSSVFEHPTAAGLAARIEQLRRAAQALFTPPDADSGQDEVEHEL